MRIAAPLKQKQKLAISLFVSGIGVFSGAEASTWGHFFGGIVVGLFALQTRTWADLK